MKALSKKDKFILATKSTDQSVKAGYFDRLVEAGYVDRLVKAGYFDRLVKAGYVDRLVEAGYFDRLVKAIPEWNSIPILDKPYTHLLNDIKEKKRIHQQSTFGPIETFEAACSAQNNICKTPMCTAGHLVNMAGEVGYKLRSKYGWSTAASLIHAKTHPSEPSQDFGTIPQDWAMAYIEEMASRESNSKK